MILYLSSIVAYYHTKVKMQFVQRSPSPGPCSYPGCRARRAQGESAPRGGLHIQIVITNAFLQNHSTRSARIGVDSTNTDANFRAGKSAKWGSDLLFPTFPMRGEHSLGKIRAVHIIFLITVQYKELSTISTTFSTVQNPAVFPKFSSSGRKYRTFSEMYLRGREHVEIYITLFPFAATALFPARRFHNAAILQDGGALRQKGKRRALSARRISAGLPIFAAGGGRRQPSHQIRRIGPPS